MIYCVGVGPGNTTNMTLRAVQTIQTSDVLVGYDKYIELIKDLIDGQEIFTSKMMGEIERVHRAIDFAIEGKTVSIISSGDSGVYAMAGLLYELLEKRGLSEKVKTEVVCGVTSSVACASLLGAPLMNDMCHISLSDLLTPLEEIFKRVRCALDGDFVIALYNPRSKTREDYLKSVLELCPAERVIGMVKNAYRKDQEILVTTVSEFDYRKVDMFTTVIIGNSRTRIINGKMITPRGYSL